MGGVNMLSDLDASKKAPQFLCSKLKMETA